MNKRDDIILSWWKVLAGDSEDDKQPSAHQRGNRAALRRCGTPAEVMFQPVYHTLFRRLPNTSRQRLAVAAAVLAHVKANAPQKTFAQQLAADPESSGKACFSGLRFRKLLRCEEPDELMRQLIHAVRLLNGTANVTDLATSILFWNDNTRQRWAFAYYDAAPSTEP